MSRYSHIFRGQESEAVEKLPDLSLPSSQAEKQKKTGTDDVTMVENSATYLAIPERKTGDNTLQQLTTACVIDNENADLRVKDGIRTRDPWNHNPMLYPTELLPPQKKTRIRIKIL